MKKKILVEHALKVREHAHAPYSRFKVGAALITESGKIFTGCNVENSSYGATICAERNALGAMVAAGEHHFVEIAVVTDTTDGCPPCGICRQALAEFAIDPKKAIIHMATLHEVKKSFSLVDLLPEAFSSAFLER